MTNKDWKPTDCDRGCNGCMCKETPTAWIEVDCSCLCHDNFHSTCETCKRLVPNVHTDCVRTLLEEARKEEREKTIEECMYEVRQWHSDTSQPLEIHRLHKKLTSLLPNDNPKNLCACGDEIAEGFTECRDCDSID